MRSSTPSDLRGRCTQCYLQQKWCVCPLIEPITISFRLVVVRHWKESWRTSNTGRLAHLAIEHSKVVDYGSPNHIFDDAPLRHPNTFLLFPSLNHSHGLLADASEPPARPLETLSESKTPLSTLVVVDASWGQARKMVRRISSLESLPRVTVDAPPHHTTRLRRPPFPGAMATIEAISAAVRVLEGPQPADTLDELFTCFVRNARAQRGGDGLERHSTPNPQPHASKDSPTT